MRFWVVGAGLAVLGTLGLGVFAQQRPVMTDEDPTKITVEVTRVDMLFTVMDKKGRFVTNLDKNNFELLENKRPQSIQEFSAETDLPLRLGILIDTSNSIRDRFKFEQQAATEFVHSVMTAKRDKAMLVSFDSSAEMVSDLVDQPNDIIKGINALRPGGGTALYDAIFYACRDKLALDQPKYKFRRAIIVVTDGDDNFSHYTRDQALEMAQKADVAIYAISTNVTRDETEGDKVLKYLAKETGGQAYFPFKVEDLEQSFENIANELRHQYIILYRPEPLITDGEFHPITLRVKGHKELIVRVRPGYYAPNM
ncbi:MAG TPA: VWA domain-containing protein [Bryobacteraceae bacterium]|jgi:VWFA-related protein|nr:VWA domain-containing protein [Bryobacteraceae bacterium]